MDYEELIALRNKMAKRIEEELTSENFDLSIRYFVSIHEALFKGMKSNNGHLRKFNMIREEDILNGISVDYADFYMIPSFLKFAFYDEKQVDYTNLSTDEVATKIAFLTATIWQIHPFSEGNTRTTCVFIEKYLRTLGYNVDNHYFRAHSQYFRNALVKASYHNEKLNITKDYGPLTRFFIAVLNNMEIEEEDLTVKALFVKNQRKRKINNKNGK